MVICCIVNCGSKSKRGSTVRFFSIPTIIRNQCAKTEALSTRRRRVWIAQINRTDLRDGDVKQYTRVCSKHFIEGKPSNLFDDTNPNWAPSLALGYEKRLTIQTMKSMQRHERTKKRLQLRAQQHLSGEQFAERGNDNLENSAVADTEDIYDNMEEEEPIIQVSETSNLISCNNLEEVPLDLDPQISDIKSVEMGCPADFSREDVGRLQDELQSLKNELQMRDEEKRQLQEEISASRNDIVKLTSCVQDLTTELKGRDQEKRRLEEDICATTNDNVNLRASVNDLCDELDCMRLNEQTFSQSDEKVNFYTGLPSFTLLMHIFSLVNEHVTLSGRCALSRFQQFLIVMMRLRLNLSQQDLAYRFGVHQSTISRILQKWIPVMSACLERAIVWPDRETLQKTMPMSFQANFGKRVAVIIDCFEVFVNRPSALLPRAGTWSQYKHNTVKILIGITPQGTVFFISKAWVGRTSDKHITENCGLLDKLLPHDVVLADRGFNISDSVGFCGATVNIPAFTRGKPQLSYDDVELTRKIANVRIHVERVIGLVRRKYTILSSTLPMETVSSDCDEMPLIDHIAKICCALVNLSPPIVQLEEN